MDLQTQRLHRSLNHRAPTAGLPGEEEPLPEPLPGEEEPLPLPGEEEPLPGEEEPLPSHCQMPEPLLEPMPSHCQMPLRSLSPLAVFASPALSPCCLEC